MTSTIRIQCRNNSDARKFDLIPARHNGGKLVIATVDADDLDDVRALLDAAHEVSSYEIA